MDPAKLHDLICRGMGRAAAAIGTDYDLFRPAATYQPPLARGAIMRLPAIIDDQTSTFRCGRDAWIGFRASFDAISVKAGDYLRGPRGTFFVGAVPERQRPFLIETNACVSVLRVGEQALAGLNGYGGATDDRLEFVLADWFARVGPLSALRDGSLPADRSRPQADYFLPAQIPEVRAGDLIETKQGDRLIVLAAQISELGWKLTTRGTEV